MASLVNTQPSMALDVATSAAAGLVAACERGGLDGLSGPELVELWQGLESLRACLATVDHALIGAAQSGEVAEGFGFRSLTMFLAKTLRISAGDAAQRVRSAAAVGPRVSMLGERLEPLLPVLAAAQRAGEVSTEQVAIVERSVAQLDRPEVDAADRAAAEVLLTCHARSFGPQDLRLLARRVVDAADPDGPPPNARPVEDRRQLSLSPLRDGMWRLEGRLSPTVGAQLSAVLTPLAKPRISRVEVDGTTVEEPDPRHHGQRLHDALDDACGRLLRAAGLPVAGGTPASVIVTVTADQLAERTGTAETTDGTLLSPEQLARVAGEADVWTLMTSATGVPLRLGRTRRIATQAQTMALIARDGGCSFPGCSHPPEYCDRHHVKEWIDGGPTDVTNLTLLCRYHHTAGTTTPTSPCAAGPSPSTTTDSRSGHHPRGSTGNNDPSSTPASTDDDSSWRHEKESSAAQGRQVFQRTRPDW